MVFSNFFVKEENRGVNPVLIILSEKKQDKIKESEGENVNETKGK